MALLKRSLILTNKHNKSNEMALLTIEKGANGFYGKIKVFNVHSENLALGIACNDSPAFKQNINLVNNTYNFTLNSNFNLSQKISAVLVTQNNNQVKPLLWASEKTTDQYKTKILQELFSNPTDEKLNKINNISESLQKNKTEENVALSAKHNVNGINNSNNGNSSNSKAINLDELFDISNDREIESIIDNNLQAEEVQSFSNDSAKNTIFSEDTFKIKNNLKSGDIFFDLISDQLEDLFSKYPSESKLEQLIPNSKWVKVDYENNGNIYVLGLIYDDINLKYICYGIPGEFSTNPPKDLESYSQWLPLDANNVNLGGYWVMYQNALTGENIKIEAI